METKQDWKVIQYKTEKYPFREWITNALQIQDLEHLHQSNQSKQFSNHIDQMKWFRDILQDQFSGINNVFRQFVTQELKPHWGQISLYQNPPTFRFHLNGSPSVSSFHRDRDYGLPTSWLNVWLPITPVWGNNTIWIKHQENTEEFIPIPLEYGEALVFDGANLLHGSVKNDTGSTRVSMDFRFSPEKITDS